MRRPFPTSARSTFMLLQRGLARLRWIIVLAVLAIATAFILPRLVDQFTHDHSPQARQAEVDLRALSAGLEQYRRDNGRYPSSQQGLLALAIKPLLAPVPAAWPMGGYVDRLPRDPWGQPYQYGADEEGTSYQLFSFGQAEPADDDDAHVIRLH